MAATKPLRVVHIRNTGHDMDRLEGYKSESLSTAWPLFSENHQKYNNSGEKEQTQKYSYTGRNVKAIGP